MFKRLIGLLIILSLVMPPFLAVGTVVVARTAADELDATARVRFERIREEIATLRTAVQPIVNTLNAVKNTLTQIRTSINSGLNLINQIATSITIPSISIPSINFPQRTINIPDIPSISLGSIDVFGNDIPLPSFPGYTTPNVTFGPFTLSAPTIPSFSVNIPGLASAVNILRDGYNFLNQTVQSIIDMTGIEKIVTSLGKISTEVEGLGTDVGNVVSDLSEPLRWLGIGIAAWMIITWLALLGSALGYGWRLLTGQA
jgi:hypothetical protein